MKIQISDDNAALISKLATYLEALDGNPRSTDDVIQWAIGGVASVRPDIAKALAAPNPATAEEN